jgi:hypothetical protein
MRDMILNQASMAVPAPTLSAVVPLLRDIARGMAKLVEAKCASTILRSQEQWYDIKCARNGSLFDAIGELRATGARDDAVFLLRLAQKTPLLTDLGPETTGRLLGIEAVDVTQPYGDALVLCAQIGGIAVSLPLLAVWDNSTLTLTFAELLDSGEIEEAPETIDNLARLSHSTPILDRDRQRYLNEVTPLSIWKDRGRLFPHLLFSPDVEAQLRDLNPRLFDTVINRLADLDVAAQEWRKIGGPVPPWRSKVSPESASVMSDRNLREARRFRSVSGESAIFEWHARFGRKGRIHLRFDSATTSIEIRISRLPPTSLMISAGSEEGCSTSPNRHASLRRLGGALRLSAAAARFAALVPRRRSKTCLRYCPV